MRKYIMLFALLTLCMTAKPQALILVNGDTIKFSKKELTRIVPREVYGYSYNDVNNMNKLDFITSDSTITFDIRELKALDFAYEYVSGITEITAGETRIYYDNQEQRVIIANGKEDANLKIYNTKGMLIKSGTGSELSVADLASGLYIVCYDDKLNVKIMKR